MRRIVRVIGLAMLVLVSALAAAPTASAHPLGNATVSRALRAVVGPDAIEVTATLDMAEIPAFSAIRAIDTSGDGAVDADEARRWAEGECAGAKDAIALLLDGDPLDLLADAAPDLAFPPGVGGLETLRLACSFIADGAVAVGERHRLEVEDRADDGRPGWREVTIAAGPGVAVAESDVPADSPSAGLTAYPEDALTAPPDVRSGTAIVVGTGSGPAGDAEPAPGTAPPAVDDPLVGLLADPDRLGGVGWLLGLALSAGLGAAHALSPGHGKALVAASLIGSRGTARQAIWLGLVVAASHTTGVLVLGALVLGVGQALAPDRLLAWLSLLAGACVVAVGSSLALRALRSLRSRPGGGGHGHGHDHAHPHSHPHAQRGDHVHVGGGGLTPRGVVALGLFGGLVPSTSAVIVLLLAVTTGQLVIGLTLIVSFGVGMAAVLGGLAVASAVIGGRLRDASIGSRWPILARAGASIPLVSGLAVLVAGAAMTYGAMTQVL